MRAALPWAIARTLESQAREQLGLPVRVANVDLWLARGAIALEGLVVGRFAGADADPAAEPDRATALLDLSRVFVDLEWADLLERRIRLRELAIDGPKLRIERDADGRIAPLGPPLPDAESAESPGSAEPSEPWAFAVDRFDLRGLDLSLVDLATQRVPIEFALERLSLGEVALDASTLGLGDVEIANPTLRIDRDFALGGGLGGRVEEDAPAAPEPGSEEPEPEAPDSEDPASEEPASEELESFAYRIDRIAIADADFTLRSDAGPIDVSIRLDAEQVSASSGARFPIEIELGIGDGELLLQGQLGLNPLFYAGELRWSDLALPPLTVAARPELAEWIRSCRAEGEFTLELRSVRSGDAAPGLELAGTATVRDLQVSDPSDEELSVAWKELEVAVREAFVPFPAEGEEPRATRVRLERVHLVEPDLLFALPATALEELLGTGEPSRAEGEPPSRAEGEPSSGAEGEPSSGAGGEPPPASDEASEPAGPPLELAVDAFALEGGRIRFRDATVTPPFDGRVADLAVAVEGAGVPELHAKSVRSTGIALGRAPFSLEGALDPASSELRMSVDRLPLRPLDPYAAGAGYRLERGEASLETRARTRGPRTEASNRLVLHRLDLSTSDPGAFEKRFGMPLDVALALLRSPGGDISLAIPVVVDESGTRTELATILQGALRQALVGALSSPLKLVGAVLPTGDGDGEAALDPLAAVPGGAELAADGRRRIAALSRLLADRPALALRLRGRTGPADRPLVAERILAERAAAGEDWPEVDGSSFFARRRIAQALEARGRGEGAELSPEDAALLRRTAAAVEIPAERMRALARLRAEAARDAIASERGIAVGRLRIGDAAPDGDPAVVVELGVARGS